MMQTFEKIAERAVLFGFFKFKEYIFFNLKKQRHCYPHLRWQTTKEEATEEEECTRGGKEGNYKIGSSMAQLTATRMEPS